MMKYEFRLFITGRSARSEKAIKSIQQLLKEKPPSEVSLEIIDVLETPEIAERDKILATPTLVKLLPPPVKRIVGDLSDTQNIKRYLDLN